MITSRFVLVVLLFGGTMLSIAHANEDAAPSVIRFNEHIRPIFAEHCIACHGGVKRTSGLSFVYRERTMTEGESGLPTVVPGDPDASYLIERVSDPDPDTRMPPFDHGPALSPGEIELLRTWIQQGAKWEKHWAFIPPRRPELPTVGDVAWCQRPLDRFILARLENEGLPPPAEAPRRALLRRVSLDLVGLPPTPDEVSAFLLDERPGAWERVVDRLLASPRFGERWASVWLDLARYAETQGYEKDLSRTIWPYRDWLIRALNADMPYDQFVIKQMAGDLLPEPTLEDLVATAFHRNTTTNTEGGTDDEEFRIAAVIDRANTTWEVFQATTMRCVQCHAHPYDEFEHDEFYRSLAFFNTSRDCDLDDDAPLAQLPREADDRQRAQAIDSRVGKIREALYARVMTLAEDADHWNYLTGTDAESTGSTELSIQELEGGGSEFVVGGTITVNSQFTLDFDLPPNPIRLTAMRIEAWPQNLETALRIPETGFMVTRLRAELRTRAGELIERIPLSMAYADEPEPMYDPQDSLQDNNSGWSVFTRIYRPRFAVFIPSDPVSIPAGTQLRLVLEQNRQTSESTAYVIRRGRVALSDNRAWTELVRDPHIVSLRDELKQRRHEREQIPAIGVPVMSEQPARLKRNTYTFVRGNWLERGEKVTAGVPQVFPLLPPGAPRNRLGLAQWLASPDNPLTARVAVNRYWARLFGTGLVETQEDFGSPGTPPSHPELLDYLALRFQNEHDWSVKSLLREFVLSAAYRGRAQATPELVARDPRNRLLARGPRNRIAAEVVRDQALAVSGLLSDTMFGPPVMPPQPEGVWRSVYSNEKWTTPQGDDRYRRAVYTYWKRTSPYPSMIAFDAPNRDSCTSRRNPTNTPLQALVTLNDPVYVECAQALAKRMREFGNDGAGGADRSLDDQLKYGYELATSLRPDSETLAALRELYAEATLRYKENPEVAADLGASRELYGLTAVANALLNLDSVLTK